MGGGIGPGGDNKAGMGIIFGSCDCDGKSGAELTNSSWVDLRLSPLLLGGNCGEGGGRGGVGGASWVTCGGASVSGDPVSTT